MAESARVFLAVSLPIRIIEEVGQLQSKLREAAAGAKMKVRWVPPPNMHVTLKFLGEIPEEAVQAIRDELGSRLAERAPVHLEVREVGAFPNASRPRVLWVGVESANKALEHLAGEIDGCLEELGFPREKRPFHPHLTLGRVKHGAANVLEEHKELSFGECTIHEVVLYKSTLRRSGAEYTALARFPLAAQADGTVQPTDADTTT
jgi:2'-5' RNA ligase